MGYIWTVLKYIQKTFINLFQIPVGYIWTNSKSFPFFSFSFSFKSLWDIFELKGVLPVICFSSSFKSLWDIFELICYFCCYALVYVSNPCGIYLNLLSCPLHFPHIKFQIPVGYIWTHFKLRLFCILSYVSNPCGIYLNRSS